MTPGKNPAYGVAVNRLRKLQRQFDFWMPKRAQYPFVAADWNQEMAEKECLRLGPAIVVLRNEIDAMEKMSNER